VALTKKNCSFGSAREGVGCRETQERGGANLPLWESLSELSSRSWRLQSYTIIGEKELERKTGNVLEGGATEPYQAAKDWVVIGERGGTPQRIPSLEGVWQ